MMRVLAIWCMDWPAVAAAKAAGLPATALVAVTLANRVVACSVAARAAGVRRGLRRRESQARCPDLHVVTADPGRDARFFETVTAAVDDLVPRAEVLRPGLLVLSVRGVARYFGNEEAAAEQCHRLAAAQCLTDHDVLLRFPEETLGAWPGGRHPNLVPPSEHDEGPAPGPGLPEGERGGGR